MTTFTWIPDYGVTGTVTPNVARIQFGDNYEQRQARGINVLAESWPVAFTNREAGETADILAFLVARNGMESFLWTTPEGVEITVVARTWAKTPAPGGRFQITATFDQVFEA